MKSLGVAHRIRLFRPVWSVWLYNSTGRGAWAGVGRCDLLYTYFRFDRTRLSPTGLSAKLCRLILDLQRGRSMHTHKRKARICALPIRYHTHAHACLRVTTCKHASSPPFQKVVSSPPFQKVVSSPPLTSTAGSDCVADSSGKLSSPLGRAQTAASCEEASNMTQT